MDVLHDPRADGVRIERADDFQRAADESFADIRPEDQIFLDLFNTIEIQSSERVTKVTINLKKTNNRLILSG